MSIKKQIAVIGEISDKIKADRKMIKYSRLLKKRNRHLLENFDTLLRRELDTSLYQTIVTPGGLWIDYDPDYKLGKVKKYEDELVGEPFAKQYLKPDKEALQEDMDDDFKIITDQGHIATIEYTQFKEEEEGKKPKDGRPRSGGNYDFDDFGEVSDWLGYAKPGDRLFLQFSSRAVEGGGGSIKFTGPNEKDKEDVPRWTNLWGTKTTKSKDGKENLFYYTAGEFASLYQSHDPGADDVKKNFTKTGPFHYRIGKQEFETRYWQKIVKVQIGKYPYWLNYMVIERGVSIEDWKKEIEHWKWQYIWPNSGADNEEGAMGYGLMLIEVWRGAQLINRYKKG